MISMARTRPEVDAVRQGGWVRRVDEGSGVRDLPSWPSSRESRTSWGKEVRFGAGIDTDGKDLIETRL